MKATNPIFEQNYHDYLNQLNLSKVSGKSSELGVDMINEGQTVRILFFNNTYHVSKP